METPKLLQAKKGWLALGDGWAVEASTEEDAIKKFKEAEIRHEAVESRSQWFYETNRD